MDYGLLQELEMTEEEDIVYGNKDEQPPTPMDVLEERLMHMKLTG